MAKFTSWQASQNDVKIIGGNTKLGKIPNISLLPQVTCPKDAPCKKGCYAKRCAWRPNVHKIWAHNTKLSQKPAKFFSSLKKQFLSKANAVEWFRFFVSGDYPSYSFLCHSMRFCEDFPNTKFLIFTKRYGWVNQWLRNHKIPKNLSIVFSAWPGYKMNNPNGLPVAWMRDKNNKDERIHNNAKGILECPGNCDNCGVCWNLPKLGRDVVFNKH